VTLIRVTRRVFEKLPPKNSPSNFLTKAVVLTAEKEAQKCGLLFIKKSSQS
jgi:hypothetical protein